MFKVIALVITIMAVLPLYVQAQVPGDITCDGSFNGLDIIYWFGYLQGYYQNGWIDTAHCAWLNGDMNGDSLYHTIADWFNVFYYINPPIPDDPPFPTILDTLKIESVYAAPGDVVDMPVYAISPDSLAGIMVHFAMDTTQVHFEQYYGIQSFWVQNYYEYDNKVVIFHLNSESTLPAGTHELGSIRAHIPHHIPPGTDITLELIGSWYYPSGFGNYSTPSYFIQPVLVDGIIHVITTGIDESELPKTKEIYLSNFPNPFNASTIIEFELSIDSPVQLIIYDLLGREIERPFSGYLFSGKHELSWDGADHPSGIYFYRLETATGSYTRRMTLLK